MKKSTTFEHLINQDMISYISLLRGFNVGGHKKVKMETLRIMFSNMGFSNVQTYNQSGNIVFQSAERNTHSLEMEIANNMLPIFGFEVPVFVISVDELKHLMAKNPFSNDATKDEAYIYFTFLADVPSEILMNKITATDYKPEEYSHCKNVIYLYCPQGYGNSKLTNSFWENKLKVQATNRNFKTTSELVRMSMD